MRVRGAAILLVGLVWVAGCCGKGGLGSGLGSGPKAGDTCTPGRAACQDKTTELVCESGKYAASPCKGPKGCYVENDKQHCDFSGAQNNDPCPKDSEDDAVCSADMGKMVVCHDQKYIVLSCRGPKRCNDNGDKVECDRSVQLENDNCHVDEDHRCTVDHKKKIVCKNGKYVLDSWCRGPGGCSTENDMVKCDRGSQKEGDVCERANDYECAMDGKTILACKDLKWAVHKKCPGKCKSTDDKIGCQ